MNTCIMIVGATTDLGMGLAWQAAKRGKQIILVDQEPSSLEALALAIEAKGYPSPVLVAISTDDLEAGCTALTHALTDTVISHWLWAGYYLANPVPLMHITLPSWQQHVMQNITYPTWLLKACLPMIGTPQQPGQVWLAQPQTHTFTHALAASQGYWEACIRQLKQELGEQSPQFHQWVLPRIADRIHRRIWPLAPIDSFVSIDQIVDSWFGQLEGITQGID